MDQSDNGVNREGLDYRAGYIEGLKALGQIIRVMAARAKKSEFAGLELADQLRDQLVQQMFKKMKGG